MQEITIEQKISLLELASKIGSPVSEMRTNITETIENYNALIKAITISEAP